MRGFTGQVKLVLVATRYGAGYNEGCMGLVDKHGVHLAHHGAAVVGAVQALSGSRAMLSRAAEAEFVCSVGYVCLVGTAAGRRAGLVVINTANRIYRERV